MAGAFELDHMLALVRRLDDAGHDRRVQERWHGYSERIQSGEASWLAGQLDLLAARIRRSTRIQLGPFSSATDAGRLRQIFWLAIWLYRTATRRRVDLPELVFAMRDVTLFMSVLNGDSEAMDGEPEDDQGAELEAAAGRAGHVAARRAQWQEQARAIWRSRPELEHNASATARAVVARMRDQGEKSPGSVHTIRRYLGQLVRNGQGPVGEG